MSSSGASTAGGPYARPMCGRFALYTEPVKVARFLQATPGGVRGGWQPSWNIPPAERIVGARERVDDNGEVTRSLELYRWGLVPFWAKDPSVGNTAFTARAETVATKPMFRHAVTSGKRILIPADTFYEWTKTGGPKVPNAFQRTDGTPSCLRDSASTGRHVMRTGGCNRPPSSRPQTTPTCMRSTTGCP